MSEKSQVRPLIEKSPIPLASLIDSINAMEEMKDESILTFRCIVIGKKTNLKNIRFNATYSKIEIHLNSDEVHVWILDGKKDLPDKIIQNAFIN